jgi:hypothetical protein
MCDAPSGASPLLNAIMNHDIQNFWGARMNTNISAATSTGGTRQRAQLLHAIPFVILALIFCGFAPALRAQSEAAEVLGTVRDATGALVSNATVTLVNQGTNIVTNTATSDSGEYDFLNVKVDEYKVEIEHVGFSKFTTDVRVKVGVRQLVDAALQVGAITEGIVVSDAAVPPDADSSDRGLYVHHAALQRRLTVRESEPQCVSRAGFRTIRFLGGQIL